MRSSPSTDADALAGEWTEASEGLAAASENGSWDPLAAVMADEGERTAAAAEDPWGAMEADQEAEWSEEEPVAAPAAPAAAATTDAGTTLREEMEELEFIRLSEKATLPTRAHDGDAGLDLYAAEGARIGPGQRVSVGTGLAVAVPQGLAGLVVARSGLALKHGIALVNAPGVIDSGYRGELRVLLLNTDATSDFKLAVGDRVAQLLLIPIATASPLEADALDDTTRGGGGFGSTGA